MVALTAGLTLTAGFPQPDALGQDLEKLVQNQQQQLDAQAAEIQLLKEQLSLLLGKTAQNTEAIATKADKKDVEEVETAKMVVSKNSAVDVTLYGQLDRAGLWADNGDASKVYFVDNANSTTRLGVTANAPATEDLSIGGKIEYEIVSNASTAVNQLEESTGADINVRHTDAWFASKRFGTLYIGRGDTATNGTAEVDLSGTSVITYSAIDDFAGGQLWYDSSTNALSELTVGDVIDNMDGLSRRNRFRYDTPSFAGFALSGSAIESGAFDLAARYERKFDGIKLAAAVGYATPGDLKSWDKQYSGSFSVLHDSGLNLTVAGGNQDLKEDNRDDPTFWYAKLGYRADLFPVGPSAFSVDYGLFNDFQQNNDENQSFSLAYVQSLKEWGTELYLAYRLYTLDRDDTDFDDVNAVMAGARLKF